MLHLLNRHQQKWDHIVPTSQSTQKPLKSATKQCIVLRDRHYINTAPP